MLLRPSARTARILPAALAQARDASRRRTRPRPARRDRDRHPALAGAIDHLIVRAAEAAAVQARSRGARHPPTQRLPTAAPRSRPRVGGRGRCGELTRQARQDAARPGSSTPCCGQISRTTGDAAASAHGPLSATASRADREAALDYLTITLSHPRWLVERWLDRHGFDATERGCAFNDRAAPLTLRANTLRGTPAMRWQTACGRRRRSAGTRAVAPDGLVVDAGQSAAHAAARGRTVRGAGRGVAARGVPARSPHRRRARARRLRVARRQDASRWRPPIGADGVARRRRRARAGGSTCCART